jgi:hypothetical protein
VTPRAFLQHFTVNLMPFSDKVELKFLKNRDIDLSYFPYDCFHPSQKGSAISSAAYWLNMLGEDLKFTSF